MKIDKRHKPCKPKLSTTKTVISWIGITAAAISLVLFVAVFFSYLVKPDRLAALTFFPPLAWGILGICLALLTRMYRKSALIFFAVCWLIFIGIFAEEPKSLLRGFFASDTDQQSDSKGIITVISLNCAGGNIQAAREIIPYQPDIVLLQEAPAQKEDLESLARELFNTIGIAYGPDCAIIAKGKLEQLELSRPQSIFMTAARIQFQSGVQTEVFSLRLRPPVMDFDLLSADCWKNHTQDRQSRRKQLQQVIEQIDTVSRYFPVIVGGDFNVTAHDGCLELFDPYLKDTFIEAGMGWGHTALNSIPLFRTDQIWANSHCKITSCVSKETMHSDHRMVICKLIIQ